MPQVLICAPESCLDSGCPGYEFSSAGISPCGIDSSASIGTVYKVKFTVFDNSIPPLVSSVSRVITIGTPCNDGEELCDDDTCSSVACDTRSSLGGGGDTTEPPQLMLHPMIWDNMTVGAGRDVTHQLQRKQVRYMPRIEVIYPLMIASKASGVVCTACKACKQMRKFCFSVFCLVQKWPCLLLQSCTTPLEGCLLMHVPLS